MTASNVDPAEIEHFSTLAEHWWDPQGAMATLHHINPLRVDYIETSCGGLRGRSALDVGCGGGLLAEALARRGARATGIDLAEAAIGAAQAHAHASAVEVDYHCIATETFAAQHPAAFDLVCCLEMLEHVPDPGAVIQACADLARPGATLVFSTLNRTPKAFALAVVGAEYLLGLIPRGTHDFAQFIRPSELAEWVRSAGLEIEDLKGMHYNPVLKSARLSDDVSVNYFLRARKPS
jgi:2-polyprenyl-6-hydroxyphenyl methylase / 3-demethylubiquinone-9 3-methyltransferase